MFQFNSFVRFVGTLGLVVMAIAITSCGGGGGGAPAQVMVVSSVPANNATNISLLTTILIKFSEAMERNSAQSAFSITPNVVGVFSWSGDSKDMTFTPASALSPSTLYTVRVGTGAKKHTTATVSE
ncbi:MAG: Ig-like domain-containing protein [bacterium JZ-2024 1]